MGDNFGIHRPNEVKQIKTSNSGTPSDELGSTGQSNLSDFLMQLEDYTPTIPDAVTNHYLNSAGFDASSDPRIVRLISIAAQKFISDIANDALIHCKTRTSNANSSHASSKQQKDKSAKDRKFTMTMEDLQPALNDYGITVRKAHYFV
ncbi:transcription initiation factor TFIID subunit 10 [Culicoides brevitarsis]|uniref:transcription initiation factor TFIID subunit 10 n=1 Tax=Culicoides brevitarsis TaxID=469753 RepID=UPI00307C36F8